MSNNRTPFIITVIVAPLVITVVGGLMVEWLKPAVIRPTPESTSGPTQTTVAPPTQALPNAATSVVPPVISSTRKPDPPAPENKKLKGNKVVLPDSDD